MKKNVNRNISLIQAIVIILLQFIIIAILIIGILANNEKVATEIVIGLSIVIVVTKICTIVRKICKTYLEKLKK